MYDPEQLDQFLEKIYPQLAFLLEHNCKSNAFSNYEVFWDDERNDTDLKHTLQTNYDFEQANKAYQTALKQERETGG